MPLADALATPPVAAVLANLPPAEPAALQGVSLGSRLIVLDGMGPGEAIGIVHCVAEVTELELVDALGVAQRVWLDSRGESHLGRWSALRTATHPVDELAGMVLPPTRGIVPVPTRIVGTAFFPGGSGLWRPRLARQLPPFPVGEVLIVGHDFGTVGQYVAALRAGSEPVDTNPTWVGLRARLEGAGIPLSSCFFTNAYLGLRERDSPTGAFPGRADAAYRDASLAVLERTIALQRPRLIITLGRYVPALLARLGGLTRWQGTQTFADIDAAGALQRGVRVAGVVTTVVALTHPSLAAANAHRRTSTAALQRGETVDDALLREAYGIR